MKKRLGLLKWDCFKCSTQQCKGSLTPQHAGTIISSDSCQLLSLRQSSHFSFKTRTPGLTLFFSMEGLPLPVQDGSPPLSSFLLQLPHPTRHCPAGNGAGRQGRAASAPWHQSCWGFGPMVWSLWACVGFSRGVDVAAISRTAVSWVYTR